MTPAAQATVAAELVRQYCPAAPADVQEIAAQMVLEVLKAGSRGAVTVMSGLDGEQITRRDPMRADAVRRSGAASILAPWRRPRARPIEAASS